MFGQHQCREPECVLRAWWLMQVRYTRALFSWRGIFFNILPSFSSARVLPPAPWHFTIPDFLNFASSRIRSPAVNEYKSTVIHLHHISNSAKCDFSPRILLTHGTLVHFCPTTVRGQQRRAVSTSSWKSLTLDFLEICRAAYLIPFWSAVILDHSGWDYANLGADVGQPKVKPNTVDTVGEI